MLALLVGEREIGGEGLARQVASGLGLAAVVAAVIGRGSYWARASGPLRALQGRLALLAGLSLLAVGLWALQADPGRALLQGLVRADPAREQLRAILAALWPLLWLGAALPMVFIEISFASMASDAVEPWRWQASARSALVLVLALGTLGSFNYVASVFEWKRDLSFRPTRQPSEATRKMVGNLARPLEVLAFYPLADEVGEALLLYLEGVAGASQEISLRRVDHALEPVLAEKYGVTGNGVLVLAQGDRHETLRPGLEMHAARHTLEHLDGEFQQALLAVTRERRVAYFTVGHGERGSARSDRARDANRSGIRDLERVLTRLNFSVEHLGVGQGLAGAVPADAALVFVVGPQEAFLPAELAALEAYLARSGRLFVLVDPDPGVDTAPLLRLVGLRSEATPLANDHYFVRANHNASDHYLLYSNRYSSHPSVRILSRHAQELATVLAKAGTLAKSGEGAAKVTFTLRSMPETWNDLDGDARFGGDAGEKSGETRTLYNLAAAVTGRTGKDAWRAVAVADSDWVSDEFLRIDGNAQLLLDGLSWLVESEESAGQAAQEDDVPIVHTRDQDVIWFYASVFGAPALVLAAGLTGWRLRRNGRQE